VQHESRGTLTEFSDLVHARVATGPTREDLGELVEAMFFASLHEEEARRVQLSVAWEASTRGCLAALKLTAPVPVTPKNLAKLAPAAATAIAVKREHGQLVAWALLERSTDQPALTITAIASGVLRVDVGGAGRALYARGEMIVTDGVRSGRERLAAVFPGWRHADVVARIAERALAHGHGGMILVIPAALGAPLGVRVHYGVADGGDLLCANPNDDAIDLVARLTAVDNALLLDTDLRVRGFGVQVLEGDTPDITFAHTNPYTAETHVDDFSTFKGTRHPAGVIFCVRQETPAAAVIASQDNRLSIASKDARGVVEVFGSYERGFGW
jgi:hypothetical protein